MKTSYEHPRTGRTYTFPADAARYLATIRRMNDPEACEHGHFGCAVWHRGPCMDEVWADSPEGRAAAAEEDRREREERAAAAEAVRNPPPTVTLSLGIDPEHTARVRAALDRAGILSVVVEPAEGETYRAVNIRREDWDAAVAVIRTRPGLIKPAP